jgi:hypothetical protein
MKTVIVSHHARKRIKERTTTKTRMIDSTVEDVLRYGVARNDGARRFAGGFSPCDEGEKHSP